MISCSHAFKHSPLSRISRSSSSSRRVVRELTGFECGCDGQFMLGGKDEGQLKRFSEVASLFALSPSRIATLELQKSSVPGEEVPLAHFSLQRLMRDLEMLRKVIRSELLSNSSQPNSVLARIRKWKWKEDASGAQVLDSMRNLLLTFVLVSFRGMAWDDAIGVQVRPSSLLRKYF